MSKDPWESPYAQKLREKCADPACFACTHSIEELEAREREAMEQEGWYAHIVVAEKEGDLANYHTHGMPHSFQHPDLQVVLPMNPNVIHNVVHGIVEKIKEGTVYEDGDVVDDLIQGGYSLKFVAATENDRPVLRIIVPDASNNLDPDTLDGMYNFALTL